MTFESMLSSLTPIISIFLVFITSALSMFLPLRQATRERQQKKQDDAHDHLVNLINNILELCVSTAEERASARLYFERKIAYEIDWSKKVDLDIAILKLKTAASLYDIDVAPFTLNVLGFFLAKEKSYSTENREVILEEIRASEKEMIVEVTKLLKALKTKFS